MHFTSIASWEKVEGLDKILPLIEEHTYDPDASDSLKKMIRKPGFLHAIAYVSDDDISCSNTLVRLYSKDGIRLELFYSQGD